MKWAVWMDEVPDGGQPGRHPPLSHHRHTVHSAAQDRAALHLFFFLLLYSSKPSFLSAAVMLPLHQHSLIKLTPSRQTLNWTVGLYLLQIIIYFCVLRQERLLKVGDTEGCSKLMAEGKWKFRQIIQSHLGGNHIRHRSSEVTKFDIDKVAFLAPSQMFHPFNFYFQGGVLVAQ